MVVSTRQIIFYIELKRRKISDEKLDQCIKFRQVSLEKLARIKFIITHKMHLLSAHSVDVIISRKCIVHLVKIKLEREHQIQFQENQTASIMSKIKGQEMKLKIESTRNSQTFKDVTEHVDDISSGKRKNDTMKKVDQKSYLSTSSMRIIKREKKSEERKHAEQR